LDLVAAIEGNVSEFLLAMGSAGGGSERHDSEVTWTVGGSPIAYHNAVVRLRASPERADTLITEWFAELKARRLGGAWHVSPSMRPSDVARRLKALGALDGGTEPAMAIALPHVGARSPRPQGLQLTEALGWPDLSHCRDILRSGFGEGPREADWAAQVFQRLGYGGQQPWHHFLARRQGQALGTGTMFLSPGVAGFYFLCVRPEARRQGVGRALMLRLIDEARRLGCDRGVLTASPTGQALYQGLGFQEVFRYELLEWPRPG
jgi:GNAT superfamily N-acetyltransferase